MNKSRQITMKIVAEKAGVDKSTVSRVISNNPDISEKTRKKVIAVMEELNYYPSAIARSLANRISKNIGLVLPSDDDFFLNPFFQESLRAIAKTAAKNGYDTLIMYNGEKETDSIKRLVNANKVDGVILMRSIIKDATVDFLRKINFPFVLIGNSKDFDDVYSVDTDNKLAAEALTEKLISEGCKKIGFIGGDKHSVVTIDRFKGYKKALTESNLVFEKNIIRENEFNFTNGYNSIEKIIDGNIDLDGIVITDPLIFNGVVNYLSHKNKYDITIGTFGTGICDYEKFKVYNIDVDCMKLGENSCKKLIAILKGEKVEVVDIVDFTLK